MPIDRVTFNEAGASRCVAALQRGELVAFPTETVYGLGCDARSTCACERIYELKGRPRTDPLIVHVSTFAEACTVWGIQNDDALSSEENIAKTCIRRIAQTYWPGPLTIIYTAGSEYIKSPVTAGTGLVGVRNPSHPIARSLIELSAIPLAAPSANLFGHTSPTTAQHVIDDFQGKLQDDPNTVFVVEAPTSCPCEVGIESTIVRIRVSRLEGERCVFIDILRRGVLTENDFRSLFRESDQYSIETDAGIAKIIITTVNKYLQHSDSIQTGPGQLMRHYAPNIPTYMVKIPKFLLSKPLDHEVKSGHLIHLDNQLLLWLFVSHSGSLNLKSEVKASVVDSTHFSFDGVEYVMCNNRVSKFVMPSGTCQNSIREAVWVQNLSSSACIDYAGYFFPMAKLFHNYQDLSKSGEPREAAKNIYSYMRAVEVLPGASSLLLPCLTDEFVTCTKKENQELVASIADRICRSASGMIVETIYTCM